MNTQKRYRAFGLYIAVILILALLWVLRDSSSGFGQNASYSYAQFESDLKENNVISVVISQNREVPSGQADIRLRNDHPENNVRVLYVTDVNQLQEVMREYGFMNFSVREMPEENWLISILPTLILFAVLFVFYIMMTNHAAAASGGGNKMMNFGKSRARMMTDENKNVTFSQVAGLKEEKEELEELVDFLRAPRKYTKLGARIPKGVLLVGPPGTGKTLLAKAVAGEAGVPFFSISGSDFVEMFVGVGASRVRDLFEQAKKNSPSIVFIDEIDAVGRRRGAGLGGGRLFFRCHGLSPRPPLLLDSIVHFLIHSQAPSLNFLQLESIIHMEGRKRNTIKSSANPNRFDPRRHQAQRKTHHSGRRSCRWSARRSWPRR